MAPKKVIDQVEHRHGNELAVKKEVAIPDIIAALMPLADAKKKESLERYLEKYNKKQLPPMACWKLIAMTMSLDKTKEIVEGLVPGYTRDWSPAPYEHPIIV